MATIRERTDSQGNTTYQVQIRVRGYPPQSSTFSRKTDAKLWAAKTETDIRAGRGMSRGVAERHTLEEAIRRYELHNLPHKARGGEDERAPLRWWRNELGEYALSDISTELISQSLARFKKLPTERKKAPAAATVLRYVMVLSHVFNIAITEWKWCVQSPVTKVARPKIVNERTRYLSDDERARLFDACVKSENDDLYLVVVLAISTGMRKGEIMGMRWRDIHHVPAQNATRVHLTKTKNKTSRSVLLAAEALELLNRRRVALVATGAKDIENQLVFPSEMYPDQPVDLRKPWEAALRVSGIKDFRFHDLRHTAASYLAMSKVPIYTISRVLGHKSTKMSERYAHLSESHVDDAVRLMNEQKLKAKLPAI